MRGRDIAILGAVAVGGITILSVLSKSSQPAPSGEKHTVASYVGQAVGETTARAGVSIVSGALETAASVPQGISNVLKEPDSNPLSPTAIAKTMGRLFFGWTIP